MPIGLHRAWRGALVLTAVVITGPLTTAAAARVVPTRERPIPASPQKSSSMTIGSRSPVGSAFASAKKSKE